MGLFSKKKKEEVLLDEITPEIKAKLDELAERGNQYEEEEQYECECSKQYEYSSLCAEK